MEEDRTDKEEAEEEEEEEEAEEAAEATECVEAAGDAGAREEEECLSGVGTEDVPLNSLILSTTIPMCLLSFGESSGLAESARTTERVLSMPALRRDLAHAVLSEEKERKA